MITAVDYQGTIILNKTKDQLVRRRMLLVS